MEVIHQVYETQAVTTVTTERREKLASDYGEIKAAIEKFVAGTNHPDRAFHDFRHYVNVAEAAKKILNAAQTRPISDPTHFWQDYENFCNDNSLSISLLDNSDLEITMELFGMIHDLGNAFEDVKKVGNLLEITCLKDNNGKNQFQKIEAENRSIKMSEIVVKHFLGGKDVSEEKQIAITKLVQALIEQTTFKPSNPNKPFAVFARLSDQVGQALVDPNKKPADYTQNVQMALLDEEYYDQDRSDISISKSYGNFVSESLQRLFGKDIDPEKILQIFDLQEIPPHLIYQDGDPRFTELKYHPINLRTNLIRKIEAHCQKQIDYAKRTDRSLD